ncbi:MAG: prolipoprotein diacylglyceryl transferase [Gammaproteobacteria bacterium]|nr:prolipoprotein diacylglyceryl transferase [Gammaproteobacteria bacterium]
MHYPIIDPVIVALARSQSVVWRRPTLAAFAMAWWLGTLRAAKAGFTRDEVSDVIFYGAIGAVVGGRVGFALFYGFSQLTANPLWLFKIWEGGMSFHGGMLGVAVALWWFARRTGRDFFTVSDFVMPMVPTGLGFGRLGNFINAELPGRPTESAFGLIYPCNVDAVRSINPLCTGIWEDFARHPSPLYQAFAEGLVLFVVLWWFSRRPRPKMMVSGAFLLGYGVLRFATEFFREPDASLGFVAFDWLTRGQLLSLPMVLFGIVLIFVSRRSGTVS